MSSQSPRPDALEKLLETQVCRGLSESAAAGFVVTRLDGSFLHVNDAFCAFIQYSCDELMALRFADVTHPDDRETSLQHWQRILAGGINGDLEKRYIRKDGQVIHALLSISAVRDAAGTAQGCFALIQDITAHKKAERLLNESEQRYKSLFEQNFDAVFSLDKDGYFLTANPAAERVSGYSQEELRTLSYVPLIDSSELPKVRQCFLEAIKGQTQKIETLIVHKKGHRVHLSLTGIPIVVDGHVEGLYGVAHDITRQRKYESSLRESDDRYRAFIAHSTEAIWRFELEWPVPADRSVEEQIEHMYHYGYLAEYNDAMARMYGYETASEIVSTRLGDFLPRDNAENIEYLQNFIASGYAISDAESQEIDKNGNCKYFLNNLTGIVEDGLLKRAWGTQRDITDRKRADELQKFLLSASAVLSASLDYETTLCNVAHLAVPFLADCCIVDLAIGGTVNRVAIAHRDRAKEALTQTMRDRYPFDATAKVGVPQVLRSGQSQMFSEVSDAIIEAAARGTEHLDLLRQVGFKSYICVPMPGREGVVGAISFINSESNYHYTATDLALAEDIGRRAAVAIENARLYQEAQQAREESEVALAIAETSRIQAEMAQAQAEIAQTEAENANVAKDEFLAVVSHELRTPLTPILGWLHLLRTSRLNEEQATQALEIVERSALLQVQLVNDLLDVSRIISGKLRLDIQDVLIGRVIDDSLQAVRSTAQSKQITLNVSGDDVGSVPCDPARLQQILWNLLSNAVKSTPDGGQVGLSFKRDDSHLIFTVSDTGIGISAEFLPHVFERFRQADSATTRRHGGLGLGLAIGHHLVEMHSGKIDVQSEGSGHGATFTVSLPLYHAPEETQHSDNYSYTAASVAPRGLSGIAPKRDVPIVPTDDLLLGLRILVLDDDAETLEVVSTVLSQHGATVTQATSTADAFIILRREKPQLLISDISMPGEDGYAFIRSLRATERRRKSGTPAIRAMALTACARPEDRQLSIEAGFQEHLSKPIDPETLLKAVYLLTTDS